MHIGKEIHSATGKVPVLDFLEKNGVVSVTVLPDVKSKTLLGLTVKKVHRKSFIYTDIQTGSRAMTASSSTDTGT